MESGVPTHGVQLTRAVVRGLYKLMAYKDEYEVARLATGTDSEDRMRVLFDGEVEIVRQLHPPTLRRFLRQKIGFGRSLRPLLLMLARMKGVRGTVFDPFARTPARKLERELVGWYCRLIEMAIEKLTVENHAQVIEIAELPDSIRGYEDVKEKAALAAMERGGRLVENLGPKG